ncbi:DUF5615 family PIN-like protein [Blastococcus saxobsidens]|uniref:DUF5615 domain-containing protein n=1 Tax=Blastococcus saxobsidens (strain DD2) TaxID=1146883 RepID=H6RTN4_BLASD|nr:DUF5615 family PIN-like protein [Blastococcus saxobsidens]CCG03094.1 conserved protein of unknown function [Blastococcus saxobsidens DD2]
MKLLLDEMIGPRVAQELRSRGFDAIAVAERADFRAVPDDAVLDLARVDGRVVVTVNVGDFVRLHQRSLTEGRQHSGIVMVTGQAFPQNRGFIGALVTALTAAAETSSLPGPGEIVYLRSASD